MKDALFDQLRDARGIAIEGSQETAHRVSASKLLWVNDAALLRDFEAPDSAAAQPEEHPTGAHDQRDLRRASVLHSCDFVSSSMLLENEVTGEVLINGETREALRPEGYGRALLVPSLLAPSGDHETQQIWKSEVSFDVKGVGVSPVETPLLERNKTGVLQIEDAFQELANQMLVERLAKLENVNIRGVPVYAIIDLGFSCRRVYSEGRSRAVALVRRAHNRAAPSTDLTLFGSAEQKAQIFVEHFLRRHRLTSTREGHTIRFARNRSGELQITYVGLPVPDLTPEGAEKFVEWAGIELPPNSSKSYYPMNVQLAALNKEDPDHIEVVDFFQYKPIFRTRQNVMSFTADQPLNWGGALSIDHSDIDRSKVNIPALTDAPIGEDLAPWAGVSPEHEVSGAERFGIQIGSALTKGTLSLQQVNDRITRFLEDVFPETDDGLSETKDAPPT